MFPIVLKNGHEEEPDSPIYYEVAANGIFEVRRTAMSWSATRMKSDVPGLLPRTETARLLAPRLPAWLMEEAVAFFSDVFRYCNAEGVVLLFYRPETQEYRLEVPEQTVPVYRNAKGRWMTSLELRYEHGDRPEGFVRCGSIHSHAELSAYASHTDCTDEKHLDGLHVVVGNLDTSYVSLAATLTAGTDRVTLSSYEAVEPFDMKTALAGGVPQEWLDRVQLEYSASGWRVMRRLTELISPDETDEEVDEDTAIEVAGEATGATATDTYEELEPDLEQEQNPDDDPDRTPGK